MSEESSLSDILRIDKDYSYRVERSNSLYLVEVNRARFSRNDSKDPFDFIKCDKLCLYKVEEKDERVWSPKLINPFARKQLKKDVSKEELIVYDAILAHREWKGSFSMFYDNLNKRMMGCNQLISYSAAEDFFKQAYEHYNAYYEFIESNDRMSSCSFNEQTAKTDT